MHKSGAWILSTYCKLYVRDLQFSKFVWKDPQDFQISKFWVRSFILWPQITHQKCHQIYSTVKFVKQSFHFPILSRNLYERYLYNSKFQNFEYVVLFLDTNILNKSTIRLILWWHLLNKTFISPFWVGIWMGGTLITQNSKILSSPLTLKYKIVE
jgi:hypothetical protein